MYFEEGLLVHYCTQRKTGTLTDRGGGGGQPELHWPLEPHTAEVRARGGTGADAVADGRGCAGICGPDLGLGKLVQRSDPEVCCVPVPPVGCMKHGEGVVVLK